MGYRREQFELDGWYHCFTRGIDKRITFYSEDDCRRFIQLLYLANDTKPIDRGNFYHRPHHEIFMLPRTQTIVSIGAYCLMNNHYHLLLKEIVEGGISRFMQKVGTGYAMYFNQKNNRVGSLFVGPFRSKLIDSDPYLQHVTQYIHLNPAEIFEHGWKKGKVANLKQLEIRIRDYPFSSLPDYVGIRRVEANVLDPEVMPLLTGRKTLFVKLLTEANHYFAELEKDF